MALLWAAAVQATSYYVDSRDGRDRNPGTSPEAPWRTLDRVNAHAFAPGDEILFRRGRSWYDASVRIATPQLSMGAYGDGEPPRLVGSLQVSEWDVLRDGRYRIYRPHGWEIQLVAEDGRHFYRKVESRREDLPPGSFYYDRPRGLLYMRPREGIDPNTTKWLVGSRDQVIELQNRPGLSLVVRDLEIGFSNRFGIGPWWQGGEVVYDSVLVEHNRFVGNAYSAVALSGGASYASVTIRDNVIRHNGAEGIYIGRAAIRERLLIADNVIGDAGDEDFGWRGEGAESPFNGDGIDIKWGNRGVEVRANRITRVRGEFAITTQSPGSIIEGNRVTDVYLPDSWYVTGISADVQGVRGEPVIIRNNVIRGATAHGIVLRGHTDTKPPVIVEDNVIELDEGVPYAQVGLLTANNADMTVRRNRGRGGRYGVYVTGLPPVDVRFEANEFLGVDRLFYIEAQTIDGLAVRGTRACSRTPVLLEWPKGRVHAQADAVRLLGSASIAFVDCPTTPN